MTRILIVEDEPVLANNIARSLEKAGIDCLLAGSAAAARVALAEDQFDLVIADISLGDGNGLDVIAESAEKLQQTPVMVMTGQDSVDNRSRAECLPVAVFLCKPVALSRLRELVFALTRSDEPQARRRTKTSVVMYSHDTIGLGHMRRNSAIARSLVERIPDISVLMLVGCPAGMVFETHPGIDYVKLPSLTKLGRGVYQAGSLRIDAQTTRDIRTSIIEGVVSSIKPSLFLVDHEPSGAMHELLPVLSSLKVDPNVRTILGLRDILDDPERTRATWRDSGTDRLIADTYDHILVYGDAGFFSSINAYGLDLLKPGNVSQCGVVTSLKQHKRDNTKTRPKRVLVSGGGGRDAYPLISAAIGAANEISQSQCIQMSVITGPLMDEELKVQLHQLGKAAGVDVLDHVNDLPALMANTDLLITMTGYNSINEALAIGCPILTVPRLGPSSEQRLRAEALERLGLARVLDREELSAKRLAELITAAPPRAADWLPDMQGVSNAANILARFITDVTSSAENYSHV